MEACTDIGILKVIYFIRLVMGIIFTIAPIILIIMGSIDFLKAIISNEEKEQKKSSNLFIKRLVSAIILFSIPWIVNVFMSLLGDLTKDVNYTTCYNNATKEYIESQKGN